jgi:hypothetical protein
VVDVFSEVDEQLRADRLRAFLRRAVPAFIAALVLSVLVVLAVEGYRMYRTAESAKASQIFQTALETAQGGDEAKAYDQLQPLAAGPGPYQALALMEQAGIRMDQNKPADAIVLFDKAAAASKSALISDAATLKSAYAQLDSAPLDKISGLLTPLTKADRPYHVQAREALALAKLGAGKAADAKSDLVALSLLQDTPDSARQRVQAIIGLIDSGTGAKLKALEEQAKTATPIPLQPMLGPQGAPPPQVQPEAAQ